LIKLLILLGRQAADKSGREEDGGEVRKRDISGSSWAPERVSSRYLLRRFCWISIALLYEQVDFASRIATFPVGVHEKEARANREEKNKKVKKT